MRILTLMLASMIVLAACAGIEPIESETTATTAAEPTEPQPPAEPPPTSEPANTEVVAEEVEPTATEAPVALPVEWPDDVGATHFGWLGERSADLYFSGAWLRPHPGPFIWGNIDNGQGSYRWDELDRWVRTWQQDRLAILATVWPFAQWDQDICHADEPAAPGFVFDEFRVDRVYSPCDLEAYTVWLTALVERYDGDGADDMPGLQYPIRHWEILNEPEMQSPELVFFQEESGVYLELLELSYAVVKAADPNTVVLPAGQAGMQPDFVAYWEPVLAAGGDFFDIGNIHSIGSDDEFFAPEYRAFLDELGYAEKSFWVTEAVLGGPQPPGVPTPTEDDFAQQVFTGVAAAFGAGAQVIYLGGVELEQPTPPEPPKPGENPLASAPPEVQECIQQALGEETFEALIKGERQPTQEEMMLAEACLKRPGPSQAAERTYMLMANTVGDFTTAMQLAEDAVRFDMPDGRTVFALWDGATLPPEVSGTVTVVTYAGEESQADAGAVTGEAPMLVVVE